MSGVVVSVEGLSKRYMIGHRIRRERYVALRDVLMRDVGNIVRRSADMLRGRPIVEGDKVDGFWALKNVNFEVRRGEVIGIIGRNGAGKSTLLKILSRITEPTAGRARLTGRVASLLEVGTGFHPELTGRENIYLNGAVLGMSRAEVSRKFDEIVAFANVDDHIDTPVKRYSSGMQVRLAFAVAAHLEPDILVVDEVLAVGDAEFQKKCLARMENVSRDGRTVLIVSHDMRRIADLCDRAVLMDGGSVVADGPPRDVINAYLAEPAMSASVDLSRRSGLAGSGEARFQSLTLLKAGEPARTFMRGDELTLRFSIKVHRPVRRAIVATRIMTGDGVVVFENYNIDSIGTWNGGPGLHTFTVEVPNLSLCPGTYSVDLWIGDANTYRIDLARRAIQFEIVARPLPAGAFPPPVSGGLIHQESRWHVYSGLPDV